MILQYLHVSILLRTIGVGHVPAVAVVRRPARAVHARLLDAVDHRLKRVAALLKLSQPCAYNYTDKKPKFSGQIISIHIWLVTIVVYLCCLPQNIFSALTDTQISEVRK